MRWSSHCASALHTILAFTPRRTLQAREVKQRPHLHHLHSPLRCAGDRCARLSKNKKYSPKHSEKCLVQWEAGLERGDVPVFSSTDAWLGFLLNANLQFHVFLVYLKCKRDSSGFQMSGTKQINFCQCIDKICISSYDIQIYLFICCLTLFSYTAIVPRSTKILYLPFFRFTGVGLKVKRLVQSLQSLGMDIYFWPRPNTRPPFTRRTHGDLSTFREESKQHPSNLEVRSWATRLYATLEEKGSSWICLK